MKSIWCWATAAQGTGHLQLAEAQGAHQRAKPRGAGADFGLRRARKNEPKHQDISYRVLRSQESLLQELVDGVAHQRQLGCSAEILPESGCHVLSSKKGQEAQRKTRSCRKLAWYSRSSRNLPKLCRLEAQEYLCVSL